MGSLLDYKEDVIAELNHQINSPLAAIRNALFLATAHTQDDSVRHYLEIANQEVSNIASRIRDLREILMEPDVPGPAGTAAPAVRSMIQAA